MKNNVGESACTWLVMSAEIFLKVTSKSTLQKDWDIIEKSCCKSIKHEGMKKQLIMSPKLLSAIYLAFVCCKTNTSYFRNVKSIWEMSLKELSSSTTKWHNLLTESIRLKACFNMSTIDSHWFSHWLHGSEVRLYLAEAPVYTHEKLYSSIMSTCHWTRLLKWTL